MGRGPSSAFDDYYYDEEGEDDTLCRGKAIFPHTLTREEYDALSRGDLQRINDAEYGTIGGWYNPPAMSDLRKRPGRPVVRGPEEEGEE